jgi:hypothetical protein
MDLYGRLHYLVLVSALFLALNVMAVISGLYEGVQFTIEDQQLMIDCRAAAR